VTDSIHPDLDAQALSFINERAAPRRRVRPRVARGLADAEHQIIDTPSGGVAAWRLGEGPAVLLVHGWEDDNSLWGPAIDAFSVWARPVVALDLPGHGFSPSDDASMKSAGLALVETAKAMGPITAVVGHSFGCGAIIHALSHGLEVEQAILIATPVPRTQVRRPMEAEGVDPAVLARADELRAAHSLKTTEQIEAKLKAMTTPMMAIHSMDDAQCAFSNSERLVALWPGAELLAVDGLGHRAIAQDRDVVERVVMAVEQA
jgi:pimeloyl-ACP methyl ester carboxylesterase